MGCNGGVGYIFDQIAYGPHASFLSNPKILKKISQMSSSV